MVYMSRIVRPEKVVTYVHLQRLYKRMLQLLNKIPKDSMYRINTEQIISYRLSVVNEMHEKEQIEKAIGCGTMNTLLSQAEGEYELCQIMISYKPWEPLIESPTPCQWKWPHCVQ